MSDATSSPRIRHEDSAIEILANSAKELREENDRLKRRLAEIAGLLASHPEVEVGNTKVHLAYHLAAP